MNTEELLMSLRQLKEGGEGAIKEFTKFGMEHSDMLRGTIIVPPQKQKNSNRNLKD